MTNHHGLKTKARRVGFTHQNLGGFVHPTTKKTVLTPSTMLIANAMMFPLGNKKPTEMAGLII